MSEVLRGEYRATPVGKVIFGPGSAAARVRGEVDALSRGRALIVTGHTLANRTDLVARVQAALAKKCVGVFNDTIAHVPRPTVLAGANAARHCAADVLVAVGGSTVMDTAKAMAMVLAEGADFDALKVRVLPDGRRSVQPMPHPKLPIIAIPTTLSGSEFSGSAGVTDPAARCKEAYVDPSLVVRAVILDPEMTVATGRELWLSTALKSLADCIEALCSPSHQPYSDALASAGAEMIFRDLSSSVSEPLEMAPRGRLQYAVWLAASAAVGSSVGLVAGLRHQLGGGLNVPHGIASTIVLPYVMEFNRTVAADRLALVAQVAGVTVAGRSPDEAAGAAIAVVRDVIRQAGLPARLREAGVKREDFEEIADHVMGDRASRTNVRPVKDKREVIEILESAY